MFKILDIPPDGQCDCCSVKAESIVQTPVGRFSVCYHCGDKIGRLYKSFNDEFEERFSQSIKTMLRPEVRNAPKR